MKSISAQPIIIKKGEEETPVPFIQILDALIGFKSNAYEQIVKKVDEVIKVYLNPSKNTPDFSKRGMNC